MAKKIEPLASSPQERLKVLEKLSKHFNVIVRIDPLIYPLNTKEIKDLVRAVKNSGVRQIITSTYKAKMDNLKRMLTAFPEHRKLWQKLYLLEGERKGRYLYLPQSLRKELITKIREETLRAGLDFSSCREGFAAANTTICDGSLYFNSKK